MLCEGRYQESCGYENSSYRSRSYSDLHNACASCREDMEKRNGWSQKAQYGDEYNSFNCYPVEQHEDGFYQANSAKPVRKERWEQPYAIVPTPADVFEKLALEWKLPPALKVTGDIHGRHQVEEDSAKLQ